MEEPQLRCHSKGDPQPQLPPGPWELPFIGSMHHLLGSTLPHRTLRDLANIYGPLMYLKLGEVPTVVVSSGAVAKEMMTTHDLNFSSRPSLLAAKIMFGGATDLVFAPHGDYWKQIRKLCVVELLSPRRVLSFRSVREEETAALVRGVRSAPSLVNLSAMLHTYTNNLIAKVAFGNACKDTGTYMSAMKEALALAAGFSLPDLFPSWPLLARVTGIEAKLERCHRQMDGIIQGIISDREELRASAEGEGGASRHDNNILDVLLNLQAEGGPDNPLTTTNIKSIILDLFVAGSGTSATAMTWAMSELMRNPEVMNRAQAEVREALERKNPNPNPNPDRITVSEEDVGELNYLKLVIKEALRLHPPAPLLVPRECTSPCLINGYTVPAKAKVLFNGWAIGRDPACWDEAESFKPERFQGTSMDFKGGSSYEDYIPFGGGRRMCPGIKFGMASMELPLAMLLYHFNWELPDGMVELDMSETAGLGARRKFELCLRANPRVFGDN